MLEHANAKPAMRLTPELVALSIRPEPDYGAEPGLTLLTDEELRASARRFDAECGSDPFWVFAYGSLIWRPEFRSVEHVRATAYGWHRAFSLKMQSWRGSPEQPGLMMALARGGRCDGIAYRLSAQDRVDQIVPVLRREVRFREARNMARWIPVRTARGTLRAMVFWAGPRGPYVADGLPLDEVARILARACGHGGSCAEYLYNTVAHLLDHGIRDRNLWRLQELVAEELEALHAL